MKIAHVSAVFPPYESGTGRVCYFNALELARRGHEVTVLTSDFPPDAYNYPTEIRVQRLPTLLRLGNAPLTMGLLQEIRNYDIIHLHFPFIFGAELTWLASKLRNIPYVITHHNDLTTVGNRSRQFLFDSYFPVTKYITVRNASKYAVVSLDHAEHCGLTSIYKRRWSDVVEIPNGVDTSIFYPSNEGFHVRQRWNIPADAPVIMFVGALDKAHLFKGLERLINGFSKLHIPNAFLLIVGAGEMRESYEQIAYQCSAHDRTIFTGAIPHDQLREYYNASDIVVLPSEPPESFGMVLVEASACGRPVIASDIPGVRSVVDHGSTGFLFQPGNIDDLVEKLLRLIGNPELRQHLGQVGRRKVIQQYSWPAIATKLEALYELVLQEKRVDPRRRVGEF